MGDRAAKIARAKARKQKFLEVENQIQALQDRISAASKPVRAKSERPEKPKRRNSVTQFLREMFDGEAALESATKKKQQRRGSGTVVQGNKVVVVDKRGRKVAELPVHKKTERIADDDSANPANKTEFAKALRRVRNQMIPGDEEDDFMDDEVRADRYARDEFGAIVEKENCTGLQKFFGLKCDKVKVQLTPEERKRDLARRKAKAAAAQMKPTEIPKTIKLAGGGYRALTPKEKAEKSKEAIAQDNALYVNVAQVRLKEELDALKRGRKRAPEFPAVTAVFKEKKDKFEGIRVVNYPTADMQPGDEPVLADEISEINGEKVRLRFIPPAQPGFFERWFGYDGELPPRL